MEPQDECDVVIIGGGPAGSTAATLLARAGHRVILLEKAHHPRFHIGESLLPMNLPVFERLGVLDQVRAMGVFKPGADFEADNERGYNTYAFRRAIGSSPPHAYQVWRQDFDKMLFEHARGCGADAREGHEVMELLQHSPRNSLVSVDVEEGRRYKIKARYVIDASGRDTFLSLRRKLRRKNHEHQSAAIFGHFRGAERRPGEDAGNISIYRFEHGWMWMIPLPRGVMSIGAVCRPDYLKQRKGRTVDFLLETLRRNPGLKRRIERATLIDDEVRVTGNYSYDSTRMGGLGWVMIGDAFAFLDPVFSSGVYLAMSGAEQAAHVVDTALKEPEREAKLLKRLERRQRTGMARFSFFIYRFNGPVMARMFRAPRNIWQVEQGVISMLAGDLFDTPKVLRRLRLFKFIYALMALRQLGPWWSEHRYRLLQAKLQFNGEHAAGQEPMQNPVRIRAAAALTQPEIEGLSQVLIDCVEGGASVSFMLPMTRAKAGLFWRGVGDSAARGERVVYIAEDAQGILGTAQIVWAQPENQPHRADVAKMLVHRRGRRRGVGAALLAAAERGAQERGKTLLVLDTVTGSDGEHLYTANGWQRCGEIPDYALWPDGRPCPTTVFYKSLRG